MSKRPNEIESDKNSVQFKIKYVVSQAYKVMPLVKCNTKSTSAAAPLKNPIVERIVPFFYYFTLDHPFTP